MREISVIIPTYNREACIVKAVESVLNQTYSVREVIVVDDGSEDNTKDVVRKINDNRVKYFRISKNHGAGAARNYGVKEATCEWIAFHDSDDEWLPEKIEKQMEYVDRHEDIGFVYTSYIVCVDGREAIFPQEFDLGDKTYEGNLLRKLLVHNTVGTPTILMRRHIFEEMNGFDEQMNALEDWEFAIRVASRHKIGFITEPCVRVAIDGNRMTSSLSKYYTNNCYIIRKHLDIYIRENLLSNALERMLMKAERECVRDTVEKMIHFYIE